MVGCFPSHTRRTSVIKNYLVANTHLVREIFRFVSLDIRQPFLCDRYTCTLKDALITFVKINRYFCLCKYHVLNTIYFILGSPKSRLEGAQITSHRLWLYTSNAV